MFFETHFLHIFCENGLLKRGFWEVRKRRKSKKRWLICKKTGNPKTPIWTKIIPKILKKPYFYSAKMAPQKVDKVITLKVAKLITLWRPKGGQTNNSPAYIYMLWYIYIYICAVELKTGPRFRVSCVKSWSKSSVKNWSKFYLFSLFPPHFIVFLGIFENTNSVTLCQNSVFAKFWGCQKWGFRKKIAFFVFSFLCWRNRNRKKKQTRKWKRPQNPIKSVFLRWSSKMWKNIKWFFAKGEKRAFSCTLSVLAKNVF